MTKPTDIAHPAVAEKVKALPAIKRVRALHTGSGFGAVVGVRRLAVPEAEDEGDPVG